MVDDKTTFEQAVDALTADRKKTTFDWTAPVGRREPKTGENDVMNALIRGRTQVRKEPINGRYYRQKQIVRADP